MDTPMDTTQGTRSQEVQLQEENAMLRSNLQQMAAMMTELQGQVQGLRNEREAARAPTPTPTPTTATTTAAAPAATDIPMRPREKLPTLSEFDGKRHLWEQWCLQAKLKLTVDGEAIGTALDQFAYVYSRLRDDAAKATQAYCMQHLTSGTGNGQDLLEHMNTSYGDPNKKERALQDLHNLQQRDRESFATFLPKFETVLANAGGTEYSDSQRIAYLKHALNKELREKLVGLSALLPKDYTGFVSYLQTIGSEIVGLRILDKPSSRSIPQATRTTTVAGPEPMDWEPTKATKTHRAALDNTTPMNGRRATWVSLETIAFRRNKNLCLRCGHAGHRITDCSYAPAIRPTRVNNVEVKDSMEEALAEKDQDESTDGSQGKD